MSFCTPENVITNSCYLTVNYKFPSDKTTFLHFNNVCYMFWSYFDHLQALTHIILNQGGHAFNIYFCNLWDVTNFTDVIVM